MTILESIIKKIAGEDVGEIKPQTQLEAALAAVAEKLAGSAQVVPIHMSYANGAWTANVSYADAKAAILAGKMVVFEKQGDLASANYNPSTGKISVSYATGAAGYMSLVSIEYTAEGLTVDEDMRQVLPAVTAENAGASLTVSEAGVWETTPPEQAET